MDSINSPEEMIRIIEERVKDATSKYIGQTFTKQTVSDVTCQLQSILNRQVRKLGHSIPDDAIKFEKDLTDDQSIIPANLYTLLLTIGIVVDYEKVKDKIEYTMENGTVIIFQEHSSDYLLKPIKPLKYIKMDFTLPKCSLN
jgi:hypothetical protein